ncbi:MAG: sugar transferase [Verrucomicrobiota bacterium]|nr:sugar transferase [Verrucomicrobiota bacterium]
MKALLICPAEKTAVRFLAEAAPLSNLSFFGKPFIHYWMEHLAVLGAKEIRVLATDRPEQVRALVGDGSRWGVRVEVIPELRELKSEEARAKYKRTDTTGWLEEPNDTVVLDHLPFLPQQKLFESHAGFFQALQNFFPRAATQDRIGLREIAPGIWAGLRTRISPSAKLQAPCWLGDHVSVGANAVIGPLAILENQVVIEPEAIVTQSLIGSETFIGRLTTINQSLAIGNILINWANNSSIKIPDAFLMSPLKKPEARLRPVSALARAAALLGMMATFPLVYFWVMYSYFRGRRRVQKRTALQPQTGRTITYYEFCHGHNYWKRWPQLWNIVKGEFAWVGNRPLTPLDAEELCNDFERLWLAAPIGLISQADAVGCQERFSDEARAHASFYAVQSSRRQDAQILFRVFRNCTKLNFPSEKLLAKPKILSISRPTIP